MNKHDAIGDNTCDTCKFLAQSKWRAGGAVHEESTDANHGWNAADAAAGHC